MSLFTSEDMDETDGGSLSVFDSAEMAAAPELLQRLRDGTATADLAAPPVVLPDFCHKEKSEMPSSIAVATRGAIRPALTDAALNCGMALAVLEGERPHARAVADFYRRVRERYPNPPGWERELTKTEVLQAAVQGGEFAAARFELDARDLAYVEEGGRLDVDADFNSADIALERIADHDWQPCARELLAAEIADVLREDGGVH